MASPQSSTHLEALTAELLGDVGKVHDEIKALRGQIPELEDGSQSAVTFAVAISAVAVLVVGGVSFAAGWYRGHAFGTAGARARSLLERWVVTPEGRTAYRLAKTNAQYGGIALLADCAGLGWQIKTVRGKPACLPVQVADGRYQGWYLPAKK